jgi:hypothetical protein
MMQVGINDWTWEEIESDWLEGAVVADSDATVVAAFNRVMAAYGRDWIQESRIDERGMECRGSSPTLRVVTLGKALAVIQELPGSEGLVVKLQKRLPEAGAEAWALMLLLDAQVGVEAEVEPTVAVGARQRMPDFRVHREGDPWTYTEVSRPEKTAAYVRVAEKADALTQRAIEPTLLPYTIEVVLWREPSDREMAELQTYITAASRQSSRSEIPLPDELGTIFVNDSVPGRGVVRDREDQPRPRIGSMTGVGGEGAIPRHVIARIPFSDERAEQLLRNEARQLPKEAPGLLMLDTGNAVGALKGWEPVLRGRLHPGQHTRVSGICLFQTTQESTAIGEAVVARTRLIGNPHARLALPGSIAASLERYADGGCVQGIL